jgi:RNA polymerase sigma-70 factor (ECF subfamily)
VLLPLMHIPSEPPFAGPDATDEALVRGMARGERDALGWLYDRYASLLLAAAIRFLKNLPQAEDLVHDVLMEAWSRADAYQSTRGTVRTWLLIRLRSRALDRIRKERRAPIDAHANPQARRAETAADSDPMRETERSRVRAAVEKLPEGQRLVLALAYFEGLTSTEIAARLEIPLGTVKSRTAAGLTKLRRAMRLATPRRS